MKYIYKKNDKNYTFIIKLNELNCDLTETAALHKANYLLKSKIKNFKKDSLEFNFLKDRILANRSTLKLHGYKVYELVISLGKYKKRFVTESPPSAYDIKMNLQEIIKDLQATRFNKKIIKEEHKTFSGLTYATVGGVFNKKETILLLQKNINTVQRLRKQKVPHPKIKDYYIGIELELIARADRTILEQAFVNARLSGNVQIHDDGSVKAENVGDHPHEVTILCKEDCYAEVISRICQVLNSKEVGAYVNNTCGMHVHFDVRNRKAKHVFFNLVQMLPLLKQMVPATRVDSTHANRYCALNTSPLIDESHHPRPEDIGRDADRYQAINPMSVHKYQTVEVRLHSGTTNPNKIINWIKVCLYAVNSNKKLEPIKSVGEFQSMFGPPSKLVDYVARRIELFTKERQLYDTRADHFFNKEEAV